ncbi:MAG: exosortase/archaeosortase family protein [Desulfomonilia bacterium]
MNIILVTTLAFLFVLCYHPTFLWLHYKYSLEESYFSHGYLIPFVSAYLIYAMKNELARIPRSSSPIGLIVIVAALLIHILGVLGDINFISGFSMVLYIAGCCLYLLGGQFTKKISFPLFFLVFMCPVPDGIIDTVALPLKALATTLSLHMIDLINIPYMREGFVITLPGSTYVVGAPCNGVRSLIAFFAVGFLFLYFIRSAWWKKGILFLLIPPISIVLNALRIAILLFIAHRYGQQAAAPESYLHDGSGLLVFIIGIGALVLFVRKINEEDAS